MLEAGEVPFFLSSSRFSWSMVSVNYYCSVAVACVATFAVGIVAGVATAEFAVRTYVFAAIVGIVGTVRLIKRIFCRRRSFGGVVVVLTPKYPARQKARYDLIVRPRGRGRRWLILRPWIF